MCLTASDRSSIMRPVMSKNIQTEPLRKAEPMHRQISTQLRAAIVKGTLAYGERLPSVQTLAHQFGTSVFTVQTALVELAEENLIESRERVGNIVRGPVKELRSVGIYFGGNLWHSREMEYYQELYRELQRQAAMDRVRVETWVDSRSIDNQTEPLEELAEAIRKRNIQALIVGIVNDKDMEWLGKLKVPLVVHGSVDLPSSVGFDDRQMFRLGMESLKQRGCRSAGLILARPLKAFEKSQDTEDFEHFFRNLASELGLRVKRNWIRGPGDQVVRGGLENFGYEEFRKLWSQREHPDGLMVWPDTVARGAVLAMVEARVRVPQDLHLILHRNSEVNFLCPLPAQWIVSHAADTAEALIDQARKHLSGDAVRPVRVLYHLEPSR